MSNNIKYQYLSHIINNATPTYGNAYNISITLSHDMKNGEVANESHISSPTHIGTHIDLPFHFYKNGQTIEQYDASFWIFNNPILLDIHSNHKVLKDEIINRINTLSLDTNVDLLMIRTGIEEARGSKKFCRKGGD